MQSKWPTGWLTRNKVRRWLRQRWDCVLRSRAAAWLKLKSVGYRPPELGYWEKPPALGLTAAYWSDPWPGLQGMLNAETIVRYHEAIGEMIRPFNPKLLKPASYELTLGPRCLVEGKDKILTERMPHLVIPQNSIVFVSMRQVLCLPHYIVGRFDLAIDFIYRGLLLGTGPQVDPGFQGALGCPLHNISNEDIQMRLDEPFAKIDFVKTVPRSDEVTAQWKGIADAAQLEQWLTDNPASNVRLFKEGKPKWREPIFGYTNGHRPTSSVHELTRSFRRLRLVGWVGAATVVLGVAALVLAALALTNGLSSTNQELQKVRACERSLEVRLQEQAHSVDHRPKVSRPAACAEP
jgi:deoxycytidine triphosphate deaminase